MRRIILLSVTLVLCFTAFGQGLIWKLDFNTIFDNREGSDYYSPDQTIVMTRLAPEIGLSLLDGTHNILGGVSWIQPMGNGWKDAKFCPIVYYNYQSPQWKVSFGMIPRTMLTESMPTAFWSDSLNYYNPTINGVLVQYTHRKGYAEMFLDWRSLQTNTQREAFNVNFNGQWNPKGVLLVGGSMQLNHLAKQKDAPEGQGVNDDFMVNPWVGVNLSHKTFLDSLTIKAGALIGLQRARADESHYTPCGALIDVTAEWKFLGIKETFYAGNNQMPLYARFGSLLNLGDPYYQAPVYSRTNVYAYIVRNRFINLEASLDFHVTKEAFGFWQQLLLRVYIDNKLWKNRNKKNRKGDYLRNIY